MQIFGSQGFRKITKLIEYFLPGIDDISRDLPVDDSLVNDVSVQN